MPRQIQFPSISIQLLSGSLVLTALLYGQALWFPIYHDDAVIMRAVAGADFGDILTSTIGLDYYRPLSLAAWKLYQVAWGYFPPMAMHLHNLVLHVVNGWLLGLLTWRLMPRPAVAWLTTGLYVTFPFSYQGVPWVGPGAHLQVAAGVLAATLLLDHWWASGSLRTLILSWAALAFATFTHPNGALAALLAASWLVAVKVGVRPAALRGSIRRLMLALVPCAAIMAAYFGVWLALPQARSSYSWHADEIVWNLTYLMQGLAFPVTQFGGFLVSFGMFAQVAAVILTLAGLAALIGLLYWVGEWRALIGLIWYIIAILPAAFQLSSRYVVDGPRLMMMASTGAALVWGVAIGGLWNRVRVKWRFVPVGLATYLLVSGAWFVQSRMVLHTAMAGVYWDWFEAARPDSEAIIVNLPAWIAPQTHVYALGSEGLAYLGDYYPARDTIWVNRNFSPLRMVPRAAPEIAPTLPGYQVSLAGEGRPFDPAERGPIIRQFSQVIWVKSVNGKWFLEYADAIPDESFEQAVVFENGLRLIATASLAQGRDEVALTLSWRAERALPDLSAFVHLICDRNIVAQADGPPLGGIHRFDQWQPGEAWRELRRIAVTESRSSECLTVRIGLYDPITGQRVALEQGGEYITVALLPGP